MSIWAYKVISSGKGGFANPGLLETFLNQLGAEGWEIIHFQSQPDNPLAFTGLARRPTQRDWTLEDAAAAAAKAEVDKLRMEFEAKFREGSGASEQEEKSVGASSEKSAAEEGLRKPRDTEHDQDADADEEAGDVDEWDKITSEDELPTFFEAIEPLMRRNQRGPGMSVGVEHLAKKWNLHEDDILGALVECGFAIPEDEDAKPAYVEYDGDMYWVNVNRRGEKWINMREKQRPKFRVAKGNPVPEEAPVRPEAVAGVVDPGGPASTRPATVVERAAKPAEEAAPPEPLPQGFALIDKIRPKMRRNRGGDGGSGSLSFLARAFKTTEPELLTAFSALGIVLPASPEDKPVFVEHSGEIYWLNKNARDQLWLNAKASKFPPKEEESPPPPL